tara:strand:- start:1397 stop:1633 length:237 start_codon:yes stop_codon:yes gene_type:complete
MSIDNKKQIPESGIISLEELHERLISLEELVILQDQLRETQSGDITLARDLQEAQESGDTQRAEQIQALITDQFAMEL